MAFFCSTPATRLKGLLWLLILPVLGAAQVQSPQAEPDPGLRKSYEIKAAPDEITIDGRLEEQAWALADTAGNFWQLFPDDSVPAYTRTHVLCTFDDENLYVAAICYDDSLPGKYMVQSLRRDFSYPVNDAFAVFLDPLRDQSNGVSFAVSPRGAEREGALQDGGRFGVSTSFDIPWKVRVQNYPNRWVAEMAIPFTSLRYAPNSRHWRVNFSRHNLKINENTVWNPVPINFNVANMAAFGDLYWNTPPPRPGLNIAFIPYLTGGAQADYTLDSSAITRNAGLDVKWTVTPSLNLDLTVNPDFSQVEVDRQVTNLDRFELFFPERRLFFLENADLFSRFGFSRIRPFFSRRIGLDENRQTVPILGGARLSGKIGQNWRVGLLNMQTEGEGISPGRETPRPPQNYTVAAFQRRVRERSNAGMIFVNRQEFDGTKPNPADYSRILGGDFNLFSNNGKWFGKLFYHQSFQPGQPGDAAATAMWLRYNDRFWRLDYNHEYVGVNYDADVGFVPRRGYIRFEPSGSRWFYPSASSPVFRHGPTFYLNTYLDKRWDFLDNQADVGYEVLLRNTSSFSINYSEFYIRLRNPFDPTNTGGEELPLGDYYYRNISASYASDIRRKIYVTAGLQYGSYYLGNRTEYRASVRYRLQPYANFSLNYVQNDIALPAPYKTTTLILFSPELSFTFRRNVFFTLFTQYNTQQENMNLNARFQWRFKPMSDLFIVISENYFSENLSIRNRAVVLKLTYWLQPR